MNINLPFGQKINELSRPDLSDTIIAVDFDGTCVYHDFPRIGGNVPGSGEVLLALSDAGAKLIVWTIRSDQAKIKNDPHSLADGTAGQELDTDFLRKAIDWFTDRGIRLHGHNINPQQGEWSSSPKCYAHIYIDDAALGCPLIYDRLRSDRSFVGSVLIWTLLPSAPYFHQFWHSLCGQSFLCYQKGAYNRAQWVILSFSDCSYAARSITGGR